MATRQRLYPTPEQAAALSEFCAHEKFLFNLSVEQFEFAARYRPYRTGKRQSWPSTKQRNAQLTELRAELPWLKAGSQTAQQQALRIVDRAFANWRSNPSHFRRPRYRSKYDTQGFSLVGAGHEYRIERLNRKWAHVKIPKLATPIRFRLTRSWADIADTRSCRITRNPAGDWHISFVAPQPAFDRITTGATIGIDRGVTNTIATSDGTFDHMPGLTAGEKRRWLNLERQLARRQPGSNRRERSRRHLARLRQRLNNRRTNWIEQTTTALVRDHDVIVLEHLQIRNMVRSAKGTLADPGRNVAAKSGLNRAIHTQRWGQFATRLEHKAAACPTDSPVHVIYVPAKHSSQECRTCHHTSTDNRKSQAVFECVNCGHQGHADTEAAHTIRDRGLGDTTRRRKGGDRTRTAASAAGKPQQGQKRQPTHEAA